MPAAPATAAAGVEWSNVRETLSTFKSLTCANRNPHCRNYGHTKSGGSCFSGERSAGTSTSARCADRSRCHFGSETAIFLRVSVSLVVAHFVCGKGSLDCNAVYGFSLKYARMGNLFVTGQTPRVSSSVIH